MPEKPQLAPFNVKELRLLSDLRLDAQAPHTISMAEPSQEIEKLCLQPQLPFHHDGPAQSQHQTTSSPHAPLSRHS